MADVLIVEDDLALARGIAAYLGRHKITTRVASTAEEAVSQLHSETFGVVILDLVLRGFGSGYYIVDAIRRSQKQKPYVVVITAAQLSTVTNLDRNIVRAIFLKPLELDVLAGTVRAALQTTGEATWTKREMTAEAARVIDALQKASETVEKSAENPAETKTRPNDTK